MNFKGHVAVGMVFAGIVTGLFYLLSFFAIYEVFKLPFQNYLGFNAIMLAQIILLMFFSALAPDIDHPQAHIRKFLSVFSGIIVFFVSVKYLQKYWDVSIYVYEGYSLMHVLAAILISIVTYYIFLKHLPLRHRGITHTLVICGLYGFVIGHSLSIPLGIAAGLGYFSHLLADRYIKIMVKL